MKKSTEYSVGIRFIMTVIGTDLIDDQGIVWREREWIQVNTRKKSYLNSESVQLLCLDYLLRFVVSHDCGQFFHSDHQLLDL